MQLLTVLDERLDQQAASLAPVPGLAVEFDTCSVLHELAVNRNWGIGETEKLDFLCRRLDITKALRTAYRIGGGKWPDALNLPGEWAELATHILLKAALLAAREGSRGLALKRFNTVFRAMDIALPDWLAASGEAHRQVMNAWRQLCEAEKEAISAKPLAPRLAQTTDHYGTDLPVTVLYSEGPIARAYLSTIKSLGLRPAKIINLVAAKDIATRKPVGRWMPGGLRVSYAGGVQRNKIHYWPKRIKSANPELVKAVHHCLETSLGFTPEMVADAEGVASLKTYSDNVETLLIDNFNDPRLLHHLAREPSGAILYTGGGIVPASLLSLDGLRFLHIHPGYLPAIRGADCTLWSMLLTGHCSASCFYMAPGIDVGDIIERFWLPQFDIRIQGSGIDPATRYRAVYSFLDPWVRSFVLREVIARHDRFLDLPATSQAETDGTTFHFMHETTRQAALDDLLGG